MRDPQCWCKIHSLLPLRDWRIRSQQYHSRLGIRDLRPNAGEKGCITLHCQHVCERVFCVHPISLSFKRWTEIPYRNVSKRRILLRHARLRLDLAAVAASNKSEALGSRQLNETFVCVLVCCERRPLDTVSIDGVKMPFHLATKDIAD